PALSRGGARRRRVGLALASPVANRPELRALWRAVSEDEDGSVAATARRARRALDVKRRQRRSVKAAMARTVDSESAAPPAASSWEKPPSPKRARRSTVSMSLALPFVKYGRFL